MPVPPRHGPSACRTSRALDVDCETPEERHGAVLMFRMIRAFQALADDASRFYAIQYVEALASRQDRVGN